MAIWESFFRGRLLCSARNRIVNQATPHCGKVRPALPRSRVMMPDMTRNSRAATQPNPKADRVLLHKGVLLAFIGLAVLIGPLFMAPSGMRDMVASSAVVGWFALVLGTAFAVLYGLRRRDNGRPR